MYSIIQQCGEEDLSNLINYCTFRGIQFKETNDRFEFFVDLVDQDQIAADDIALLKDLSDDVLKNQKVKDYIKQYESESKYQ